MAYGPGEEPELQADLRHKRREAEDEGRGAEVRREDDCGARTHLRVGIRNGEPPLGQQHDDEYATLTRTSGMPPSMAHPAT